MWSESFTGAEAQDMFRYLKSTYGQSGGPGDPPNGGLISEMYEAHGMSYDDVDPNTENDDSRSKPLNFFNRVLKSIFKGMAELSEWTPPGAVWDAMLNQEYPEMKDWQWLC